MKKIILAGGSGYLGRILAKGLIEAGYAIVTLARSPFPTLMEETYVQWDGKTNGPWVVSLEGAEAVINLSGRTVNCRYSKKNRAEILGSRIDSTQALGEAMRSLQSKPKAWLNSSTATIYRHALDRPQTEDEGELGKGFSVEIAKQWEATLFSFADLGVRLVALRTAMVFGPPPGGVYEAYRAIARQGLGGSAGRGDQYVSWLHADDFVGMILWILDHKEISGPVNLSSPEPIPNKEFMRELRRSLGIHFALPTPEWLLELGALLKKTETELLLKSRRVVPKRLLESGYALNHNTAKEALRKLAAK